MSKAKEEYYNNLEKYNLRKNTYSYNYIKELEQQNKEMLSMLREECIEKCIDCGVKDFLGWDCNFKDCELQLSRMQLVSKITGKSIDEVLKDE